jgi:succinyl-diaminopimelate desuccinylase
VDQDIEPAADLAFVCDEETGGKYGMQCLLAKKILSPCDCLIAEPTHPLHPTIGQKGLLRLNVTFTGEPGHASLYPMVGVSAIMEAFSLLEHIRYLHQKEYPVDPEIGEVIGDSSDVLEELFGTTGLREVLRKIMFNPGTISGGEKANIVAQHCSLELDLRIPWGCDPDLLLDNLRSHAPNGEFRIDNSSKPSFTSRQSSLVKKLCAEIAWSYDGHVTPVVQWAATDARHLRCEGFDVVEYGPGEVTTLHAVNEKVRIETLKKTAGIYERLIRSYSVT